MQRQTTTNIPAAIPAALADFDQLPDAAYIDVKTVARLRGGAVSTVWAHVKSGLLPRPKKFGRSTRWQVGAIRRALAGEVTA